MAASRRFCSASQGTVTTEVNRLRGPASSCSKQTVGALPGKRFASRSEMPFDASRSRFTAVLDPKYGLSGVF